MKDIIKKDWPYLLLAISLIVLSILMLDTFKYGFTTIFDQAYMLLKLQEAYDGSYITGKSQWNLIAIHLFPYLDLTDKSSSYLAANILNWITILIGAITASILFDKKRAIMYFAIVFLVFFQNANQGMGLSYVTMQGAFLCWAICFFMLFVNLSNDIWKCVFAALTGIVLALSCFTILPGALAVSACIFVLIIWMYYNQPSRLWKYLLSGIGGGLAVLIYMHFAVCPLNDIWDAMVDTSKFFTKGNKYDAMSMFIMFAFFFRGFMLLIISFTGIYYLSQRFEHKLVGKLFYIMCGVILVYYCNRISNVVYIEAFTAMATLAFIPYLFSSDLRFARIEWANPRTYYYLFLFLFPVIAVLGTNTEVYHRTYLFVITWLLLFFQQTYKLPRNKYGELLITVMLFFVIPCSANITSSIPIAMRYLLTTHKQINSYHFDKGNSNFAKIGINESQYTYFQEIDSILNEYNFVPHQSTMFAMVYDYTNIYVFDAVNASRFHNAFYFPYMDTSGQDAPDFLFICRLDSLHISKNLENTHWDWPAAYDKYVVGSPEDPSLSEWYNTPAFSTRYLYCRRSLRKDAY